MAEQFGILAAAYDAMINWDKRLANEGAFFREVLESVHAKSVLDAACGTGRHAGLFASWGLRVQGADASEEMIGYCRSAYSAIANMDFVVRPFTEPAAERFDAVVCVGNSLALVKDAQEVQKAVHAMAQSLNPGGALILHVMNLFSREDGPSRWDKTLRTRLHGRETLIVKGTRRCGDHGYVEALLVDLEQETPVLTTDSTRLLAVSDTELKHACDAAGLVGVELFGNYRRARFNLQSSGDLVVVAHRQQ